MLPTLRPGAIIVAYRKRSAYIVNDIVILRHGGLEKIKRITALRADKAYVAGDNPQESTDSRRFGWIPITSIQGKVLLKYSLKKVK